MVALSLLLIVAAVLAPSLISARRIAIGADRRVAAQNLLRSLLDAPVDRSGTTEIARAGSSGGFDWRIETADLPPALLPPSQARVWRPVRLRIEVSSGERSIAAAETVRLMRAAP